MDALARRASVPRSAAFGKPRHVNAKVVTSGNNSRRILGCCVSVRRTITQFATAAFSA